MKRSGSKSIAGLAFLFLGLAALSPAQSTPSQPQPSAQQQSTPSNLPESPAQSAKTAEDKKREREKLRKEQSQRLVGFIPNFGVTNRQDAPPLTPGEKFHLFAKSAFDPLELVLVAAQAGITQATDGFPQYGQGAEGYGKRFGAAFADEVSAGFFANFFYPTILKQDPRYFRRGEGTFKHRMFYAVKQEFVAHTDSGGRQFHYSNVLGALTAGSISNAYYPSDSRGFGLTMSRAGIALLYGGLGAITNEFYPDAVRVVLHRHHKDADSTEQKQ